MKNNQTGELPEVRWDRLLRIKTAGRDDSSADQDRYPYEPTPYSVLERLAGSGWIRKGNILLDYGCGKGRVGLFMSCQTRCRSIGVEYDPRIYEKALVMKKLWRTKVPVYPLEDPPLSWPMPNIMPFPPPSTGFTFSTHFPWSFSKRSWPGSWTHIMSIRGLYCCFFIILQTAIYHI